MIEASGITVTSLKLIKRYEEDCAIRGMSRETIRRYISSLGIFSDFLETHGINILNTDRDTLREFLDYLRSDRGVSHSTLENYFASLASFFGYLEYENLIVKNPVLEVRKRYLRKFKDTDDGQVRKLISVEEMARLINSTLDTRDKAIITLLAKTGIRRNELIKLDVDDIDWAEQSIRLKPTAKRTNALRLK